MNARASHTEAFVLLAVINFFLSEWRMTFQNQTKYLRSTNIRHVSRLFPLPRSPSGCTLSLHVFAEQGKH